MENQIQFDYVRLTLSLLIPLQVMRAVWKHFDVVLNLEKREPFEISSEKKHTLKPVCRVGLLVDLLF